MAGSRTLADVVDEIEHAFRVARQLAADFDRDLDQSWPIRSIAFGTLSPHQKQIDELFQAVIDLRDVISPGDLLVGPPRGFPEVVDRLRDLARVVKRMHDRMETEFCGDLREFSPELNRAAIEGLRAVAAMDSRAPDRPLSFGEESLGPPVELTPSSLSKEAEPNLLAKPAAGDKRLVRRFWLMIQWHAHLLDELLTGPDDLSDFESAKRMDDELAAWIKRLAPLEGPGEGWSAGKAALLWAEHWRPELATTIAEALGAYERVLAKEAPITELHQACNALAKGIKQHVAPKAVEIATWAAEVERLADKFTEKWAASAPNGDSTVPPDEKQKRLRLLNAFYQSAGEALLEAVYAGAFTSDPLLLLDLSNCFQYRAVDREHPAHASQPVAAWTAMIQRWTPQLVDSWGDKWDQYPDSRLDIDLSEAERLGKSNEQALRAVATLLKNEAALAEDAAGGASFASEGTAVPISESGRSATDTEPKLSRTEERAQWLAKAMLLVRDHPEWTDRKIATEVGRAPSQLSRSEEYQTAAGMARGDKSDRPTGHVTVDPSSGLRGVEAYSDAGDPAEKDWDD